MGAVNVTPNVHNYMKFFVLHFQGWRSILEKCENLVPQTFGAIW